MQRIIKTFNVSIMFAKYIGNGSERLNHSAFKPLFLKEKANIHRPPIRV
jgi:hypothetical protein